MTLTEYFNQLSTEQAELLLTLFGMKSLEEVIQFYQDEQLEFNDIAKETYDDMLAEPSLYM